MASGQPQPSASQPSGSASHASRPSASASYASQPSGSASHASQPSGSASHASQPSSSASHASQPSGDMPESEKVRKLPVLIDIDGVVVDDNAAKWSTRVGSLIRARIPISYTDWRFVQPSFKDQIWDALMLEFEVTNVDHALARSSAEKNFSQKFRYGKWALRKSILSKYETLEEQIAACPNGIDPYHWEQFVRYENTPKVMARKAKNVENIQLNDSRHTLGRDTYANRMHKMNKENPDKIHGRVDSWKAGHERRDGTVLQSARPRYELVEAAQNKRKNATSSGEGSATQLDYDNDELTEVFGADKKSRTRGISSYLSKKQLQRTSIAKVMVAQARSSSNSELKGEMSEMKSSIARVEGVLMDMLKLVTNNGMPNSQPSRGDTTPGTDVGSNSVCRPTQQNLMNMFESVNPPAEMLSPPLKVTLLGRDGAPVAKGYVMTTTANVCHGRDVLRGEKKIYIEEVLVPNAPIYDGPQYGCSDLSDFVEP